MEESSAPVAWEEWALDLSEMDDLTLDWLESEEDLLLLLLSPPEMPLLSPPMLPLVKMPPPPPLLPMLLTLLPPLLLLPLYLEDWLLHELLLAWIQLLSSTIYNNIYSSQYSPYFTNQYYQPQPPTSAVHISVLEEELPPLKLPLLVVMLPPLFLLPLVALTSLI